MTSRYATFPVKETIELAEISQIRRIADRMVEAYATMPESFSYRILLPRGDKSTGKAKRLGISLQGEFILGVRRKNFVPRVRELRYLHDESHYGWLLADPAIFDSFETRG